mgnify:CR=1 FL=1
MRSYWLVRWLSVFLYGVLAARHPQPTPVWAQPWDDEFNGAFASWVDDVLRRSTRA